MTAVRLLRLELRRSAMLWMLPLVAALFWLLPYRRSMALPPMWNVRAMTMQGTTVAVLIPTVVGAAAWTASREVRRGMTDLLAGTAWPRWARQLATWAATTCWAVAGYLACVAVLYGMTARQTAWGGPLWWPAAVGAVTVPALSALGFVAGTLRPSRFTPPLAAVGAFVGLEASLQLIHGSGSSWQVLPLVSGPWEFGTTNQSVATFYRYLPDLPVVQLIFLVGLIAVLLGLLGVPAAAGGRALRRSAAAVTVAGALVAGTAVALASTGRLDAHGMIVIPALHDAADDRPVPYTPVCSSTAIPVCLHPAYAVYLPAVAAALDPVLRELAGLPGAPVRISQTATVYQQGSGNGIGAGQDGPALSGTPPEYRILLPNQLPGPTVTVSEMAAEVRTDVGRGIVAVVVGDGSDRAQIAVAAALLHNPDLASDGTTADAARRFAALPAGTRHAWLIAHLTDLRAGRLTLEQLP